MFTPVRLTLAGAATLAIAALSTPPAPAAGGPTDPQIVGIVITANQIDIDYGKIALARSKNKQVREFAQRMMTDHAAVQRAVIGLAGKLGVTAAPSPLADTLKSGARDVTAKLESLSGAAFDRFYIENEVGYHHAVNGAVASVLIPSAANPELKSALEGAQPLFLKHEEHARIVQAGHGGMGHK